VVEDIIKNN